MTPAEPLITPAYCQLLARYNRWMNERLVAVVGLAALSLAGCSVKTFAVNKLGDALSAPGPSV